MTNDKYIMEPYDDSLRYILRNGKWKKNRTGVDTLSVFGYQAKYDISDRFPLVTKRKITPKAVFAELLWIISGSTNNKDLQALGSEIWTPWVSKEFEDKHGYVEGALGPLYGFALRHFGGFYGKGCDGKDVQNYFAGIPGSVVKGRKYGDGGFDQLLNMVKTLRENPDSRSNLFSLWNPQTVHQQRLPCCHYTFQVDVTDGVLSGMLTQRSADAPVGVAFNVPSYSALIYMLAQQCGLKPGTFIHSMGDMHIYRPQIPAVEEYISREGYHGSPQLKLRAAPDILSYTLDDFKVVDYKPLPTIKIPVAV